MQKAKMILGVLSLSLLLCARVASAQTQHYAVSAAASMASAIVVAK